ncbi:hypothetical protein BEL04_00940 [Mucilaginibacter sp. PPCGB 2223]|uniref:PspC domain-containing protein n=1 Tax=Mucilaginibacter sp. PPCGB 2223 TaxID=1886027 RepID=UPI0008242ECC|nr:PspC domain-containing protein [Mucilaginibacter sp. PPCGB 2223]OCX52925.1 hypothetical protein BEL04_00940 [Mucilaginibacter sp. PPCGB 2223]
MENRLYRDENAKVLGGVCAGLADYFNVDVALIRVAFVFAMVVLGTGFLLYLILWIVVPKKNYFDTPPMVDYTIPPAQAGFAPVRRRPGNAAIVGGTILILMGIYFLLDQFDMIPYFELHRFWPVVFIVIGLVLIFNPDKRKHFDGAPWDKKEPEATETKQTDTDNPENI